MDLSSQRKEVRAGRTVFRWCRIAVGFAVFLVVAGLAYLHLVGLPDFLKPPLLQRIRDRGFEARFTNARLGWGPAIVIENASFSPINRSSGPRLSAGLTEVMLNGNALLHRHLKADSVEVFNGQMQIPVSQLYGVTLPLAGVHLRMRLFSNDVAQLSDFGASFCGIRIRIDGEVTNFASISDWKLPARWQAAPHQPKPSQPAPVIDILEQIHFAQNPKLDIHFSADGNDMNTLRTEAMLTAPVVETPWGSARGFQLRAAAAHVLDFGGRAFMQARAVATNVTTRWGTGGNLSLVAAFFADSSTPFNASLNFAGEALEGNWNSRSGTNWVRASRLWWDGKAALSPTNFRPSAVEGTLRVTGADSPWGSADTLSLALKAARADAPTPADTNWGIWTRFSPYVCWCRLVGTNIQSPQLRLDSLALEAKWQAPQLAIEKLEGRLYEGRLDGGADVDIESRQLRLHAATDFDPHRISQVLTPGAQRWISQFTWRKPPAVNAQIQLALPPWTNRSEGWRSDLGASVQLAGGFSMGAASFRQIEVTSASGRVFYTNRVWNISRLDVARADGSIELDYTGNGATREFRVLLDSHLDPADALPWLEPQQQRALGKVRFSSPPEIHAEVRGRWNAPETITFTGTMLANKFTVRGESIDEAHAIVEYTNHLLRVSGLGFSHGSGRLEVPLVCADIESNRVTLTDAQSTLDPQIVLDWMGTNAPAFFNSVHFDAPPTVQASGSFVWGNPLATDMRFEIQGEHFHWTNLGADKVSGTVQWVGRNIKLTHIQARLYNSGKLSGWLAFDDTPGQRTGFRSVFTATDVDLGFLARGLTGKSSRVEGMLDGNMALTASVADNKETWVGHGYVHIHDALLWDIRIFGVLSPLLNAISPGAGDSRARQATAHFSISEGKVSTDDLEIHSTDVRLLYRGSVTMNKQIKGHVEADLLRDTPVFGRLLSLTLSPLSKLFEYQISGPLQEPVFKPLYVPKFIMLLLRPFHTLKGLLPEAPSEAPPNAAPTEGK
jgi:hypothetical protein